MYQARRDHPEQQSTPFSMLFICVSVYFGMLCCAALVFGSSFAFSKVFGSPIVKTAYASPITKHIQVNLSIVINQPGMQKDWPAYTPNQLVVPAHSLVTVTVKDYDLGDTPLPDGSPFTTVQGVVGGRAYVDGKAYGSLPREKVAHTFSIPQLNINVPLPGDAPAGASHNTVTFTFHTGKAGTYTFQCFDPCGTGTNGFEGPMVTRGYMVGTLTVQ